MELTQVLKHYGLSNAVHTVLPFGTGLINHTWKIQTDDENEAYILQRINTAVFKEPEAIAFNIRAVADYLKKKHPGYLFLTPVQTKDGADMYYDGCDGYFRLFPFLANSRSYDVVRTPSLAFEAAKQFGRFTNLLSGFDATSLKITLPDFHNLHLRFEQFTEALLSANKDRMETAGEVISTLLDLKGIAHEFSSVRVRSEFSIRVTHHDTKISNILFDQSQKGLCVIDLDTVMPGHFISDVGDMMRTYLSPVSEEEKDFNRIEIRDEYFKAIVKGYLSEMNSRLSKVEKEYFVYAGKFMIYMQALRFLTDYLNDDRYYGSKYEGHNLIRAKNQTVLLQKLIEKEEYLSHLVRASLLEPA